MLQDLTPLERERAEASLVTVANANELLVQVLKKIMGNEISDSLNDNPVAANEILMMAQSRFDHHLETSKAVETSA